MPRGQETNPGRKPIRPAPPGRPPSAPIIDPALQCCQAVSKKLDALDKKVTAILVEISDLDSKLDGTNRRLGVISKKLDALDTKLDEMNGKLDQIVAAIPGESLPEPAAHMSIDLGEPADKPKET